MKFKNGGKINTQGFLLISSLFVLTTMIVIVSFYLNAIIQNVKTSKILNTTPQVYYLAEAGIQEAFWKLQNDAAWKNSFETDPNWQATITRADVLAPGGAYAVSVVNNGLADATITATSTLAVASAVVQRVVETSVFKALSEYPINNIGLYANNGAYSLGSALSVNGGDIFSNDDIDLVFFSNWNVTGEARSIDEILVQFGSTLSASAIHDSTRPPIPPTISMPQIDFDSPAPESFKSRANQIYTTGEFRQLMKNSPVTLNGITYVTGNAHIKKGEQLTVNGILAADGSIKIGNATSKSGPAIVDINNLSGQPSGLISKSNITIGGYGTTLTVDGLVYAGGNLTIQDGLFQDVTINIQGGIIAQDSHFLFSWNNGAVNITLDQSLINNALGTPTFSPVLLIRHWEEEY